MKNRALGNKLNNSLVVGNASGSSAINATVTGSSSNNNNNNNISNSIAIQRNIVVNADIATFNNNVPMQQQQLQQQRIVSEWEDNILFDVDDPDFCNIAPNVVNTVLNTATVALNNLHLKVPSTATATITNTTTTTMSMASVHNPQFADQFCSPLVHSNLGMSASLPDLVGSPLEISVDQSTMLTIEELRQHMGSCFTCGVSWTDDHVSLDCSECGGYSLERPCPLCDGECGVQWKRDFTMSHACSKARWVGVCTSYPEAAVNTLPVATTAAANATTCATAAAAATQLRLAQELCSRLEQLSSTGTTRI